MCLCYPGLIAISDIVLVTLGSRSTLWTFLSSVGINLRTCPEHPVESRRSSSERAGASRMEPGYHLRRLGTHGRPGVREHLCDLAARYVHTCPFACAQLTNSREVIKLRFTKLRYVADKNTRFWFAQACRFHIPIRQRKAQISSTRLL